MDSGAVEVAVNYTEHTNGYNPKILKENYGKAWEWF